MIFPHRLYPIIDTLGDPELSHVSLAQTMLDAGVRFLQLRIKDQPTRRFVEIARRVKAVTDRYHAQLIVNDRTDMAKMVDAAGVHLGQEDLPVSAAREILGPNKIIGLSTHNSAQAEAAARQGIADYIGFGPIYPTASKERTDPVQGLEGLRLIRSRVGLPIVAIGGITAQTMPDVLAAGADAVAMIGDIVRAGDVGAKIRALLEGC
ncbi:MAG: thiamine phosphate synthase [Candidatus Binatia bacterium]|jgi:thiamine-phosphate pyrophosphorylase